jgi:hypothetical protein
VCMMWLELNPITGVDTRCDSRAINPARKSFWRVHVQPVRVGDAASMYQHEDEGNAILRPKQDLIVRNPSFHTTIAVLQSTILTAKHVAHRCTTVSPSPKPSWPKHGHDDANDGILASEEAMARCEQEEDDVEEGHRAGISSRHEGTEPIPRIGHAYVCPRNG